MFVEMQVHMQERDLQMNESQLTKTGVLRKHVCWDVCVCCLISKMIHCYCMSHLSLRIAPRHSTPRQALWKLC